MTAKKALLIGLIVILVLFGIPMLMPGMATAQCQDCTLAPTCATCVPAILAISATFAFVVGFSGVRTRCTRSRLFLRAGLFERPPQLT